MVGSRATPRLGVRASAYITLGGAGATRLLPTAGVGGAALTLWSLRRAGLGTRGATSTLLSFLVLQYAVFLGALVVAGGLLALGISGHAPLGVSAVPAGAAALAIVTALVFAARRPAPAAALASGASRATRVRGRLRDARGVVGTGVRDAIALLRSGDLRLLGAPAYWAFDAAVLWAMLEAFGAAPSFAVVVLAYFVGQVGNTLPIPGAVSGGMAGVLIACGVPADLAVVSVLAYRSIAIWLPAPIGLAALRPLRRTVAAWAREDERPPPSPSPPPPSARPRPSRPSPSPPRPPSCASARPSRSPPSEVAALRRSAREPRRPLRPPAPARAPDARAPPHPGSGGGPAPPPGGCRTSRRGPGASLRHALHPSRPRAPAPARRARRRGVRHLRRRAERRVARPPLPRPQAPADRQGGRLPHDVDGVTHGAFAAIDPRTGAIVGEARYAPWPGRESVADLAVTVADELQRRRIGTALAAATVEAARAHGVRTLTASTLWENVPARALLRRLGFRPTGSEDGVVELELDLAATAVAAGPRDPRARRIAAGGGGGRRLTAPRVGGSATEDPVPDALRPGPLRTAGHLAVALRRSTALRRGRWTLCAALLVAAVVLGGPGGVLLGLTAGVLALDALIPMPGTTVGEADDRFWRLVRRRARARRWRRLRGRPAEALELVDDRHGPLSVAARRDLGVVPIALRLDHGHGRGREGRELRRRLPPRPVLALALGPALARGGPRRAAAADQRLPHRGPPRRARRPPSGLRGPRPRPRDDRRRGRRAAPPRAPRPAARAGAGGLGWGGAPPGRRRRLGAPARGRSSLADVRWYLDGRSGRAAYDAGHLPGRGVRRPRRAGSPRRAGADGRHPLPDPATFARGMARARHRRRRHGRRLRRRGRRRSPRGSCGCCAPPATTPRCSTAAWRPGTARSRRPAPPRPPGALHRRAVAGRAAGLDRRGRRRPRTSCSTRASASATSARRTRSTRAPGHIPGARSLPAREHLDDDGRLLPADGAARALRGRRRRRRRAASSRTAARASPPATPCWRSSTPGWAGAGCIPGSCSQWSRDPARPVATGEG